MVTSFGTVIGGLNCVFSIDVFLASASRLYFATGFVDFSLEVAASSIAY